MQFTETLDEFRNHIKLATYQLIQREGFLSFLLKDGDDIEPWKLDLTIIAPLDLKEQMLSQSILEAYQREIKLHREVDGIVIQSTGFTTEDDTISRFLAVWSDSVKSSYLAKNI